MNKNITQTLKALLALSFFCIQPQLQGTSFLWTNTDNNNDLTDTNNWTPSGPPATGDTATFDSTAIGPFFPSISSTSLNVDEIIFSDVSYNINNFTSNSISLEATGVTNNSGVSQLFQINNAGNFIFNNSSSADSTNSTLITYELDGGGLFTFNSSATASTGKFMLDGNSSGTFNDNSTAHKSFINLTNGSNLTFNNSGLTSPPASADLSTITANNGSDIIFNDNTTASKLSPSHITLSGANINFNNNSDAALAVIAIQNNSNGNFYNSSIANQANITVMNGSNLSFNNTTSASTSTILFENNSNGNFNDGASAHQANITMMNGSNLNFSNSSSSSPSATADQATINVNSNCSLSFNDDTTASGATPSNITITGGNLNFYNNSDARKSNITLQNNANGSFNNNSHVNHSIVVVTNGSNLNFNGTSGENSQITFSNGSYGNWNGSTLSHAIIDLQNGSNLNLNGTLGATSHFSLDNGSNVNWNGGAENGTIITLDHGSQFNTNGITANTASITADNNSSINWNSTQGNTSIIALHNGSTMSLNTSSSDSATFTVDSGSMLNFSALSDAGTSMITVTDATINFQIATTAAQSLIALHNSTANFGQVADAGSATINADTGSFINFNTPSSSGNMGTINLTQGSSVTFHENNIIGSINSDTLADQIVLNGFQLRIGSNNANTTIVGTISDGSAPGGSLVKIGGGTLILLGVDLYSGGTTVSAGTLQGNTTSLHGVITDNADLVFNQTVDDTFNGTLFGYGNFIKEGAATLSLAKGISNTANFTGNTFVNHGKLALNTNLGGNVFVDIGGILSGNGKINGNLSVLNGGSIAPGNSIGTIIVLGDYNQQLGSTYFVQLDGTGNSSLINVSGTGTLLGGTVSVTSSDGTYLVNHPYGILSASEGLTGDFSNVLANGFTSFVTPILTYDNLNAYVTLQSMFSNIPGLTPNEQAVVNELNAILTNPNADEALILSELLALTPEQQADALNQMSGQQYTTMIISAQIANRQFLRRMYDPLRCIVTTMPCEECERCDQCNTCCSNNFDVWVEAGYGRSFLDNSKNVSGFKTNSYEISFGGQYNFMEFFTLGLAGGYSQDNIDYNLSGNAKNKTALAGIYGLYRPQEYYVLADIAFGCSRSSISRSINFGTIDRVAHGKPTIKETTLYAEVGKDLCLSCLLIQPFIGIEADFANQNKFKENDALSLNLNVFNKNINNIFSRLGVHLTASNVVTFSLDLAWQYRFSPSHRHLTGEFQEFGTPFTIIGREDNRNSFEGIANVSTTICDNFLIFAEVSGQRWFDVSTYTVLGGIEAWW